MKKSKKILSAAITAALAVSPFQISSFSANALGYSGLTDIETIDDALVLFEDNGVFQKYVSQYMDGFTGEYHVTYLKLGYNPSIPEQRHFAFYTKKESNCINLTIDDTYTNRQNFIDIFNKYNAKIGFDYLSTIGSISGGLACFKAYDREDSSYNYETIIEKKMIIEQMCKEMYEAGVLVKADYNKFIYDYTDSTFDISKFSVKDQSITEEELSAVLEKVSDKFTVTFDSQKNIYICANNADISHDDVYIFADAADAVKEAFPDAIIDAVGGYNKLSETDYKGKTINLLDPYICDIDGSGKADTADATAILKAYAESAAGLQKTAADNKMDVNGDGEVNIEDATYVLTYYAEAAAGIR